MKDKKENIIIVLLIILILVILGCTCLIYKVYKEEKSKEKQITDYSASLPTMKEIEQSGIVATQLEDDEQDLVDTIALWTILYGDNLLGDHVFSEDSVIFLMFMHYIEKYPDLSYGEGQYTYVISKERLQRLFRFISKEDDMDRILNEQYDASINYNNYKIEEKEMEYHVIVGGHGGPTDKVILEKIETENNKLILTYKSVCTSDSSYLPVKTANIVVTLNYNGKYSLDSTISERVADSSYSCMWT